MRTVWLAFFCLIGLAITAAIKLGLSPYTSADYAGAAGSLPAAEVSRQIVQPAGVAASPDAGTIETNIQNTSSKGDELEASYPGASADAILAKTDFIAPAETEPKRPEKTRIVSRHWHDPLDKRNVRVVAQTSAKRKLANSSTDRPRIVRAQAPKP